jgi:hypothetical protein
VLPDDPLLAKTPSFLERRALPATAISKSGDKWERFTERSENRAQ